MDVSYGKKVKDTSSRGKTSKEEWKEREASANQTVPTRIKIFEGGSVERLTIGTLLILAQNLCPRSMFGEEYSPFCLSGINPTRITCTSEAEDGENTFARSAVSAVRSPAC